MHHIFFQEKHGDLAVLQSPLKQSHRFSHRFVDKALVFPVRPQDLEMVNHSSDKPEALVGRVGSQMLRDGGFVIGTVLGVRNDYFESNVSI